MRSELFGWVWGVQCVVESFGGACGVLECSSSVMLFARFLEVKRGAKKQNARMLPPPKAEKPKKEIPTGFSVPTEDEWKMIYGFYAELEMKSVAGIHDCSSKG